MFRTCFRQEMSVHISVEKSNRKCLNLASFANGTVNSKHAKNLQVDFLSRKNCTNLRLKEHRIMVAETEQMSYVGKNFGEVTASKAKGLCKYYVGVLDPKTKKMKVYDTEKFLLQPHIPARLDEVQEELLYNPGICSGVGVSKKFNVKVFYVMGKALSGRDDELDTGQDQSTSLSEKKDMLTSAFGSSRKRKAMESRQRHTVETDVLEGALNIAVDKGLSKAQTYKPNEGVTKDWEDSLIPPYNKDAKTPGDVYNLRDIIANNEMDMLTMSAKPLVDSTPSMIQEWRKTGQFPTYILNQLGMMPLNAKPREQRAKCLLYLHYMIHLYLMKSKEIKLREPLPTDWPVPIKKKLLDNFTRWVQFGARTQRCCPSSLKDKLLSYILTLCLMIDEYNLDLTDLIKDLKIGKVKMDANARALGCNLTKKKVGEEQRFFAILKVPLTFPAARNKLRRQ